MLRADLAGGARDQNQQFIRSLVPYRLSGLLALMVQTTTLLYIKIKKKRYNN